MKDTFLFMSQMVRRWRTTGAIMPSGAALSRAMARAVGPVVDGQVILELGPGTGVFTRELVKGFPKAKIVAVEVNDVFAARLASTAPDATVVPGCASKLAEHLAALGVAVENVAAVVSGLPLLSLPKDLGQRIFASIGDVLLPGRHYVQFTYSERAWRKIEVAGFHRLPSQRVWINLPPAMVLTFVRDATSASR